MLRLPCVSKSVGLSQIGVFATNCYEPWAIRTITLLIWFSALLKKEETNRFDETLTGGTILL